MNFFEILLNLIPILIFVSLTYVILTRKFNDNQLKSIQLMSTIICFVMFILFNFLQKRVFNQVIFDTFMLHYSPIVSYILVLPFIAASGVLFLKDRIFNNKRFELIGVLGLVVLYFISALRMPLSPMYFLEYEYRNFINMTIYTIMYQVYVLLRFLIVFTAAKRYKQNNDN